MHILFIVGILAIVFLLAKLLLKAFFPATLNFLMKRTHSKLRDPKMKLFTIAFDQIQTDSAKKTGRLDVLEIGVGTGENFKYYPSNTKVTILDKTDKFRSYFEQSILDHKRPDLNISNLVVNNAENMHSIESNSMDAVLHTFFICSVNEPRRAMSEIYRVLKPGGVCIFMEHAIDNKDIKRRIVQKCVEPLLGDCSFKDIRSLLDSGVYDEVKFQNDYFMNSALTYFADPIVCGYGKKYRS